jgi:protein SCO1/2
MTFSRALPWLIAAAALAGALGLHLGQRYFAAPTAPEASTRAALVYPQPRVLEDFLLERTDGRPLTLADWRGRWSVVFIGFTHCPDVCPQTLALMRDIERAWPAQAGERPGLYFVSVDPERDDAKTLADYAAYFSPSIVAARGDHERLLPFTRQLGMIYMRTPLAGGDYTVDHSAHMAVVDPLGRLVALFRPPLEAGAIVADLVALQADAAGRDGG